jgi:KDO2-lipid IV(A) lauroyltransferase
VIAWFHFAKKILPVFVYFRMAMDIQQLINSPSAIRSLSVIARAIPPRIGYLLCDRIAARIAARRDSALVQAVRCNQWMARGANLHRSALDNVVRETLQNTARDIYNLYHYLHNPQAMQELICMSPEACGMIQRSEFSERGMIVLGLHLSNFDFVLRSIVRPGLRSMILTIPNPQGGRGVEYEMRKQMGMNIVPASVGALRGAIKHLKNGGMLVTGLDRPIPHPNHKPKFFGQPASLPIHYVSLASKAQVPIVVMAVIQQADGKYHVFRSDFIEYDSKRDEIENAENVLKRAEEFIRWAPQQWNVPLPVWPQFLNEVETLTM